MTDPFAGSASRREFLQSAGRTAGALWVGQGLLAPGAVAAADGQPAPATGSTRPKRPRVAAVFTEFRFRSHAYNILENFLAPYLFRGKLVDPGVDVVSFYADQFPENDMAREVSRRLQIPLHDSIDKALCCGGRDLAVDAVLIVAEHGEYPTNELGQKLYPRKQFFDAAVATMRRSDRFVPVFNDKHLSVRWDWAKEMYDTAKRHGIPFLAGSSVPLAERRPPLEFPTGAVVEECVQIHAGALETYDFHGLEVMQSLLEFRKGGETGISAIELLTGEKLAEAGRRGRWSWELAEAAMAAELGERRGEFKRETGEEGLKVRRALLVTYKDGTRGTVLQVAGPTGRWNVACRLQGRTEPWALSYFVGPWGNRNLFKALSHSIQHLFRTGEAPYPVERTLLVTGAVEASMRSHAADGKPIATPHLEFGYEARDFRAFREDGSSWKILAAGRPEHKNFAPGDARHFPQ